MAEQDLKQELAFVKGRASELSGDVDRLKKELGASHDRVAKLETSEEENVALKDQLKAANDEVTKLRRQLESAAAVAERGENAIALAKTIVANLDSLKRI